jgi:hypothetical protein
MATHPSTASGDGVLRLSKKQATKELSRLQAELVTMQE